MNLAGTFEKDSAKRSRMTLEQVLRQAGATVTDKRKLRCPFHDDKHPSGEIRQAASGFWYFYCYVCQISDDVFALKARITGQDVGEILKEMVIDQPKTEIRAKGKSYPTFQALVDDYKATNPNDVIEEQNPYTDPDTNTANFYTLRLKRQGEGQKTFRQVSKTSDGWEWKGPQGKAPLFNRARVAACEKVLIVEGEKCVREFTKLGMENVAATTSPGGAMNALKADWTPLAGKSCYIFRDFDEPGTIYERDVIAELSKLDCKVFRVRVEELDLDAKGDLVDYLNSCEGTNAEKVAAVDLVILDAEPIGATLALAERFDKIATGQFRAIPFKQKPLLSDLSKALMPGTLTTVCGDPGAGKSFFVLEDAWRWVLESGEKVKVLMLEDDDAFHQGRALAQMSGYGDITDVDFVADNSTWAKAVLEQHQERLDKFAKNIETTNSAQRSLDEIAQWIQNHAENGVRVIIVDPITAAKVSDKPWIDDQKFLFRVKNVLEQTGASLILTTHPRLGQAGKPSLSGMAGGASYPRFSQCVLWLKNHDQQIDSPVFGGPIVKHKQTVEIRKARNGKGQGQQVAINLNFQNLCFDELGVIDQRPQ
jgi:KaiC/GvpD/RAD55 family RecA-like ATPase/5S rRNA maturation endonuclease (ribonuclease M5)